MIKELQAENADFPMLTILSVSVTDTKPVQPKNVLSFTDVICGGRVIFCKSVQPINAPAPISCNVSDNTTVCRFLQFMKACASMVVTQYFLFSNDMESGTAASVRFLYATVSGMTFVSVFVGSIR